MESPRTRRQVLALVGSGSLVGSAGCLDNIRGVRSDESEKMIPDVDCTPDKYPSLSTDVPAGAWSPTRGNQQRTGANHAIEPLNLEDTEELQATELFSASSVSLPAVANGTAYLTDGGTSYAVDVESGERHWSRETGWFATPLVTRETVYLPGEKVTAHALARESGSPRWSVTLNYDGFIKTRPLIAAEHLVIGHTDGDDPEHRRVTAMDIQCGSERWSVQLEPEYHAGLATDGETVYAATRHHVYALDATDGTEHWRVNIPEGHVDSDVPPVLADETVFVSANGTLHALATADGSERWNTRDGPNAKHPPTVTSDTVYVVESATANILALDITTGETEWTYTVEGSNEISTPLTAASGLLYSLEQGTGLVAIDMTSGTRHAHAALPNEGPHSVVAELAVTPAGIVTHSHHTEGGRPESIHRLY